MATYAETKTKLLEVRRKRTKGFITSLMVLTVINTLAASVLIKFGMINVFFFFFLALLPTIMSVLWDRKPGRFASKTVAAFNIAGCTPHILAVLSSGTPDSTSLTILRVFDNWITIYGFATAGWIMIYFVPQLTAVFLEFRGKFMEARMEEFQNQLLEEWGEDIRK